jgi:hypothetical protein
MFEFVENVVYINSEERKEQKQQIEIELLKFFPSNKIRRFNAIHDERISVGFAKSHIQVLEMAIENGWSNYLVVEDDSKWSDSLIKGHSLVENLRKGEFDVVTFGISEVTFSQQYKLMSGQTPTAYLVSQHYYPKLLENFKEGLDKFLQTGDKTYRLDHYWKRIQVGDNWFCSIPPMMIQRHFSEI